MKLIDKQIGFLTEKFFTGQTDMPGAGRIANELLITGSCTVAGDGRLWNGGVGNFIRSEHAPGAVGCSLLRFDLAGFLSSSWVQEYIATSEKDLRVEVEDLQASITALQALARMGQKYSADSQTNVPCPPTGATEKEVEK
jgi:hypothetical protein